MDIKTLQNLYLGQNLITNTYSNGGPLDIIGFLTQRVVYASSTIKLMDLEGLTTFGIFHQLFLIN